MIPFSDLSSVMRALFAFWAFMLCMVNVLNLLLAVTKKRYPVSLFALPLLAPAYFAWQVIFDLSLTKRLGTEPSVVSRALGEIVWLPWFIVLFVMTLATATLLAYNVRYEKNNVTPNSIKTFLDKMPCGICCWRDNGKVLFSNVCMNRLCVALTGEPLMNGNYFSNAISDDMTTVDGKQWRFICRDTIIDGERLHEMIASDVTAEYAKTIALERDKAELSRLNRELKEYTLGIDETVRRQEILQAKVNIHDEMNRLMLSTMAAESEDREKLDKIFALWEQNALLLCMEAEKTAENKAGSRIRELADALKIRLTWQETLPDKLNEDQRALFFSAAQEALANAAKHAHAENVEISFHNTPTVIECRFANDGTMPERPVNFSGGLANLARLAKEQNATIATEVSDKFTLLLIFDLKNTPNG